MHFIIPGTPIAKKRPKFFKRGPIAGAYNQQKTEEGKVQLFLHEQMKRKNIMEGALEIDVNFYMPIPKSTSKKNTEKMIKGEILHIKKPDLDNLIKFIKDCANQIVWKDDSQIFKIYACKQYSSNPRTVFIVDYFSQPIVF